MTVIGWIIIGIAAVFLIWVFFECFIPLFDEMVRQLETARQRRTDINAKRMQRRELLPQVVALANSYALFESGTLGGVAIQKAKAQRAKTPALCGEKGKLLFGWADARALGDNWPILKANERYSDLMRTAEMLMREIADAWMTHNEAVRNYRAVRCSFWGLVVGFLSFGYFPFLTPLEELPEEEKVTVEMGTPLHSLLESLLEGMRG